MMQLLTTATTQAVRQVEGLALCLSKHRLAFRESLLEVAAPNDAQSGIYWMDVGGASFHTHQEVLHRHEGMLSAMASNIFTHDPEIQEYMFLDRDPTWFPLVLHFLRTGATPLSEDAAGRVAVFREAQYYCLEKLCQAA